MSLKSALRAIPLVALVFCPAAEAGWLHASGSVFRAETEIQKHPPALSQMVEVPRDLNRPSICVAYNSTLGQSNQGRVVSTARVLRTKRGAEPTQIEVLNFAGGVRRNSYVNCKKGRNLQAGDIVLFEHDFKSMPRIRDSGGRKDFAEVNGVVSGVGEPAVDDVRGGIGLARGDSPLRLIPGRDGGWYHSTNSIMGAEIDNEKHPKRLVHTMVMPERANRPLVCSAYSNNSSFKRRGRIVTRVRVFRGEQQVQRVDLGGGVRNNDYVGCKRAGKMLPGDVVEFSFELLNMPRLERRAGKLGFLFVHGAVSTAGAPVFFKPPPPPPPPPPPEPEPEPEPEPQPEPEPEPDPPPPPPPPPPPSGGGISQADERAVSKLMINNRGVQLWRSKNDSPARWQVVGPKTRAHPGTNRLILSTAGVGNTPAQAVADYERKKGSLGPSGALLSAADRAALVWYSKMSTAGGPTSVRRDGGGGYHGEYYRPGKGANHKGPLGSFAAAVNWLKSQGL